MVAIKYTRIVVIIRPPVAAIIRDSEAESCALQDLSIKTSFPKIRCIERRRCICRRRRLPRICEGPHAGHRKRFALRNFA